MPKLNRREAVAAMAAFSMLPTLSAQEPQTLATSRVFKLSEITPTPRDGGGWGRQVTHGTLPTGEFVEVHQSALAPGKEPHPPHKHNNTEFLLIREGKLAYFTDGHIETVAPGDVIYTASNQPHGLKNIGDTLAIYFVVSVGIQDKSTPVNLVPPKGTATLEIK